MNQKTLHPLREGDLRRDSSKDMMVLLREDEFYNTNISSEEGCFRDFVGGTEDGSVY